MAVGSLRAHDVGRLLAATLVPLACWRVSTTLTLVDDRVVELELFNVDALGGHLTASFALDIRPGAQLTPVLEALRPYAFPLVLLAVMCALVAAFVVVERTARALALFLAGAEPDDAAASHLRQVTFSVGRAEQLLSERQMELAALQSKGLHLEEEIQRLSLDVDRRQRELRAAEAQQAEVAAELRGARARPTSYGGASPTASSAMASSPATSYTLRGVMTPRSNVSEAPPESPGAAADARRLLPRGSPSRPDSLEVRTSPALRAEAVCAGEDDEFDLTSPVLDRFAHLLGLDRFAASHPPSQPRFRQAAWPPPTRGGGLYDVDKERG